MKTLRFFIHFLLLVSAFYATHLSAIAQNIIERVEPPHWWADVQNRQFQLLIYGKNLQADSLTVSGRGLKVQALHRLQNPNYLFADVLLADDAAAGVYTFTLYCCGGSKETFNYSIKAAPPTAPQGLSPADLIYLIMPDRFANGDPHNDAPAEVRERDINRKELIKRHGGDLQGVLQHLDYIQNLGATALWLNPVLENDQPFASYHGYACTDSYRIDPRHGTLELYQQLSREAKQRGIKMVMDIVHNHVGDQHWFIRDLPAPDWIHQHDTYTQTTYRATTLLDPHAANADRDRFQNGWFDTHMHDLNLLNPYLAPYVIPNNIWWVKEAGIDALRMDTYTYSAPEFLEQWADAVQRELPTLSIFAEVWDHGTPIQMYFSKNKLNTTDNPQFFRSGVAGMTDFQLHFAILEAVKQPTGWTEGLTRLYYTLTYDFLYDNPNAHVIFLDNHDVSRFFSEVNGDMNRFKMGIALLYTLRGIPCLYYGTELLMQGKTFPMDNVRTDVSGGWQGDARNQFTAGGRTAQENEVFDYIQKLGQWRKGSRAVQTGKLTHFVPENGVYVYFRHTDTESVMVVANSNEQTASVTMSRFAECLKSYHSARNVVSGETLSNLQTLNIPKMSVQIFELK
ncbi:MAG: glycoside hydrolase family 13 protein [Sphingobacteriales bacterium]|nr:glycoside hydrolase family 13 protein [Sphingobacteriales bacterium]